MGHKGSPSKADWDDLSASLPINKTAALVTGQARCQENLTPEQERQNLVARHKRLSQEISGLPKKHWRRKQLGKEIQECQKAINSIRPKIKGPAGVANCFVEVCRERMSKVEFHRFMTMATRRAEINQEGGDND